MTTGGLYWQHLFACLLIVFVCCFRDNVCSSQSSESVVSYEKLLIRDLLKNYTAIGGREGRPVRSDNTTVMVDFRLGLLNLAFDAPNNVLVMSTWTRMSWTDEYLRWTPDQHGNVTKIRVGSERVWIPDIMLTNTVHAEEERREALVVINHEGRITWFPHVVYRFSCSLDFSNYPYDEHLCELNFGSWTYKTKYLDFNVQSDKELLSDISFKDHHEGWSSWELANQTSKKYVFRFGTNSSDGFTMLAVNLTIRRKPTISSALLVWPCVMLGALTLLPFCLDPQRYNRTIVAVGNLISFMFLLLSLLLALPLNASAPTIGIYYTVNITSIVLSIILSSAVAKISLWGLNDSFKPPAWLSKVATMLSPMLLVKTLNCSRCTCTCCPTSTGGGFGYTRDTDSTASTQYLHTRDPNSAAGQGQGQGGQGDRSTSIDLGEDKAGGVDSGTMKVQKAVTDTASHREWLLVAKLIDRCLFILYTLLFLAAAFALLPMRR